MLVAVPPTQLCKLFSNILYEVEMLFNVFHVCAKVPP